MDIASFNAGFESGFTHGHYAEIESLIQLDSKGNINPM